MERIVPEAVQAKLDTLRAVMRETGGCAVAFSGGVDSSLVLAAGHEQLSDRCLAVIATSSTYPEREYRQAHEWVESNGIPHVVISSEELDIPEFAGNPANRCFYCKTELFTKALEVAKEHGIGFVADGTNYDDRGDYRPGREAAKKLGIISPLMEAEMTKEDIRTVAREVYRLPVADKPSMACLASRFPYGSLITREKLGQVERIEVMLETMGFRVFRARHHGDIVRIELGDEEMKRILDDSVRSAVVAKAKAEGFSYVAIDMEGYRTGSMNDALHRTA